MAPVEKNGRSHRLREWYAATGSGGNETVSVVRDALTGCVVAAEHVTSSATEVITALRSPAVALEGERKGLGMITDAQEREWLAVQKRWPNVPHQVCPFHMRGDVSLTTDRARRKLLQR